MSTSALLAGLAGLIDTAGLGVFDPARVWTLDDTETAITVAAFPEDPPKLIVLTPYTVADDARLNDSVVGVQIRLRGDEHPATTIDLNDALFGLFQGMHDTTVGGVPVVLMWRQSSIPGPADDNHRFEHSANWYLQTAWPSTYRTD